MKGLSISLRDNCLRWSNYRSLKEVGWYSQKEKEWTLLEGEVQGAVRIQHLSATKYLHPKCQVPHGHSMPCTKDKSLGKDVNSTSIAASNLVLIFNYICSMSMKEKLLFWRLQKLYLSVSWVENVWPWAYAFCNVSNVVRKRQSHGSYCNHYYCNSQMY